MDDCINNIILVDADDVIWDLLKVWIEQLNSRYNLSVNLCDCHDWNMQILFPMLNKTELYGILSEDSFWDKIEPREDSIKYLSLLHDEGFEIYIATASSPVSLKIKSNIIERYFPFIDYRHIISIYNKQMLNGFVMIDDYDKNLIGGNYQKLLFSAQHNLGLSDAYLSDKGIQRVNSWLDVYNAVKTLKMSEKAYGGL